MHWHSFLDERPGYSPWINIAYQRIAYLLLPLFAEFIITTSPRLRNELKIFFPKVSIDVLPCSLGLDCEQRLMRMKERMSPESCLNVLFIGRLDSYKRVDWLIEALKTMSRPWRLSVVGDGPKRTQLESFASSSLGHGQVIQFYGKVTEAEKCKVLSESHVLVLPSDRCNEAFGIVQLEAMASGIPALAFDYLRSGMSWVSDLDALPWSHQPEDLPYIITKLLDDGIYKQACKESRSRYMMLFSYQAWHDKLRRLTIARAAESSR